MDDPIFKKKYQKYKLKVKLWEKDFKKKNGRVPSKYDIREASQEIRDSYKMYYKLKTSFLEDTLNDVLSEDGFDVFEMSQADDNFGSNDLNDSLCESVNGGPQLPLDISSIIEQNASQQNEGFSNVKELPSQNDLMGSYNNDENAVIKDFEAEEELELNTKAWGENVQMKTKNDFLTKRKPAESTKTASKINLNVKLFRSSSTFSKRNPRKSLSHSNSSLGLKNSTLNNESFEKAEVLPDLETILNQKAKEQQAAAAISSNILITVDSKKESIKSKVDEGWLARNTEENGFKTKTNVSKLNTTGAVPKTPTNFGLTNLDISKFKQLEPKTLTITDEVKENLNEMENQSKDVIDFGGNQIPDEPMDVVEQIMSPPKKINIQKSSRNDSDSVVSESDGEEVVSEYRHRAKRRRILPASKSEESISVPATKDLTDPTPAEDSKCSSTPPAEPNQLSEHNLGNENENAFDFQDSGKDEDPDFIVEKKKTTRKKAVGRRAKAPKKEVSPKEKKPRQSVARKEKASETSPKATKPRVPKTPASTRASRTRVNKKHGNDKADLEADENALEEKPLNPEDLKIALTLENGDLTSVPRIRMSDLEQADNVASQYINTVKMNPLANARIDNGLVDEKRLAAKKKLEEKIASGKLNENFVTIDLQKKKYARGKRSVNYSKYKKKVWKHKKKIAALAGPEMDMGGCDGGVLKCFTCGQAGHFAQNCKIKGDNLLPLTAALEEDPSPFMSLEEAAAMASAKSYAVHGGNINRLPQAPNVAIYKDLSNSEGENDSEEKENEEVANQSDEEGSVEDEASGNEFDHVVMESDEEIDGLDIDELTKASEKEISPIKKYVGHKIPLDFLEKAGLNKEDLAQNATRYGGVGALYELNEDGSVPDVTPEVMEALHLFGHTNFRKGQDRAIMRILCGLSTLVTLSTGSGKSLCYQLPAYLYSREKKSITLVVSPLVSLMEDQVTGVPHFLRAHCLHTNQTPQQKVKIMQMISDGEIDILLVSPEAIVAGERSTGFGSILRQLPPIAFACIDEAHCVSQWSHNFRPSYLMVCKVLKKNLGVKTVLGLTATATLPTRISIINHLGIPDADKGIISDTPLPDNLILSISKDERKDAALLQLLLSERFEECNSIIIYCTRRDECERIAGFLRTYMQDRKDPNADSKKKRKRVNWQAEPYHAGMNSSRRRTIQNAFMKNELRIVVATVAFGMGINKPDIRAVIHYNMPRNFESYVQEIGRAGRDGKIAHCHLFLDPNGNDQQELRRHVYANSIDRHVIRKLLSKIFVPCSCDKNLKNNALQISNPSNSGSLDENEKPTRICPGHEIGFSMEKTVELLDIPEENISTLLCYMELDNKWGITVLSSAYVMAKVISYGGSKYLKHAAKDCPPLAMAIAMEIKKNTFKEDSNIIEFSVVDVAAAIGWNSGVVKYQLKNLEWIQVNGHSRRSPISVSFFDLGFRIKAPGDFSAEEIDDALDTLYERSVKQEKTQLIQLQYVFQGLSSVAYNTYAPCCVKNFSDDRGEQLKAIIRDYFQNNYPKDLKLVLETSKVNDDYIIGDINSLINLYPDNNFSGRNIARLFHGISSPNYPAVMWYRCKYWRAHCNVDFNRIVQLANAVIVRRRT